MPEELSKTYDPKNVEQKWYKIWEENQYFRPEVNPNGKPFTIVIPPPNVTGSLHMGHALDETIQDIIIRYHRMKGDKTLWLPGTDHAGIATQNVVEKALRAEGKTKDDMGREKFVEKVWEWKEEYGGRILQQLRRLGASCDWSRERFTLDEGLSNAVRKEFVQLYKEGLVYRGKRLVNWCPRCKTAISDIEVDYVTKKGKLWYLKYPLADDKNKHVIVATTRPETMLGDTAVAVNPKDSRFKHMIGKMLELPLVGRKIPIIADAFVDPEFGTGAVKVTPAHDPNDFEMGERHNLPRVNILTETGEMKLDEFTPEEVKRLKKYDGMDRFKVRKAVVADLEAQDLLDMTKDYENSVGHCYRCKTMVEPYLSDQWYVAVKKLAKPAMRAVEEGKIKFLPDRWTKVYINWMTNLKDWCVSRQLWWGHQIPVWYCECEEIIVSETTPTKCPKCSGSKLTQDPDVFDTWFSSCLWPFSTLGWPQAIDGATGKPRKGTDLDTFYPTSVLVTGYDIITFWISRMIMMGLHFMKDVPFNYVFVHGLVRDKTGKKMSKSLGNVVDPLKLIDEVGADALRFALTVLITGQGQDMKLSDDKIKECRNFCNKIWNVSRFVMMNITDSKAASKKSASGVEETIKDGVRIAPQASSLPDRWILSKYNRTVKAVSEKLNGYNFGEAARLLYDFLWGDFCDWYVELSKSALGGADKKTKEQAQAILVYVLGGTLKLLHPFMPFITEEIYQKLEGAPSGKVKHTIVLEAWPKAEKKFISDEVEAEVEILQNTIRAIRNIRAEMNVPHSKKCNAVLVAKDEAARILEENLPLVEMLTNAAGIAVEAKTGKIEQAASGVVPGVQIYIPLAGLIDLNKEKERLQKVAAKLEKELTSLEKRLQNKNFTQKAPQEAVAEAKNRQKELANEIKLIQERTQALN